MGGFCPPASPGVVPLCASAHQCNIFAGPVKSGRVRPRRIQERGLGRARLPSFRALWRPSECSRGVVSAVIFLPGIVPLFVKMLRTGSGARFASSLQTCAHRPVATQRKLARVHAEGRACAAARDIPEPSP